jgi:integrating conjugative element protein (TIGR03765 family)
MPAKRDALSAAIAALLWSAPGSAAPVPAERPVVVYSAPDTVPAAPYWQQLARPRHTQAKVTPAPRPGVMPLEARLPLTPTTLRPGLPATRSVAGLTAPLFILGMDPGSLHWLAAQLDNLRAIGASGFVVQAADRGDWRALQQRAQAAGLPLALLPDAGLAAGYGVTTYPVLLLPPGRAGEGGR